MLFIHCVNVRTHTRAHTRTHAHKRPPPHTHTRTHTPTYARTHAHNHTSTLARTENSHEYYSICKSSSSPPGVASVAGNAIMKLHFPRSQVSCNISAILFFSRAARPSRLLLLTSAFFPQNIPICCFSRHVI